MAADPLAITHRRYDSDLADAAGVLASWDENDTRHAGWCEVAAEGIRALNHLTSHDDPIPAPIAYSILGELQMIGHRLPQTLTQLSAGLKRSLEEHAVYENDGADPTERTAVACAELEQARAAAEDLGRALEAAQAAIAKQALAE